MFRLWQIQVLFFETFYDFFFSIIFGLQLVESADMKPEDTEKQLYMSSSSMIRWMSAVLLSHSSKFLFQILFVSFHF